jgi:hypothetical protein
MFFAAILSARFRLVWPMGPFAAAVFINGPAQMISSILTRSYSPGVITGLTLWIPLGAATLSGSYRFVPLGRFLIGIAIEVMLHLIVTLNAITG